jgi:hypothetical protein
MMRSRNLDDAKPKQRVIGLGPIITSKATLRDYPVRGRSQARYPQWCEHKGFTECSCLKTTDLKWLRPSMTGPSVKLCRRSKNMLLISRTYGRSKSENIVMVYKGYSSSHRFLKIGSKVLSASRFYMWIVARTIQAN